MQILFLSSNGTGLGHLTRSMAIARRLDGRSSRSSSRSRARRRWWREQGFPVEFAASYATPTAGSDWRWSRRLRGRLRAAMREADPRVLVFDGAHPYQALIDAMPSVPDAHRVWCRRPMWKPGSNFGALERDALLRPGARAGRVRRLRGPRRDGGASRATRTASTRSSSATTRSCSSARDAERELGLEPGRRERPRPARPGRGGARRRPSAA